MVRLLISPLSWLNSVKGFDQIGRTELRNKIIGTNKWIGTAGTTYTQRLLRA